MSTLKRVTASIFYLVSAVFVFNLFFFSQNAYALSEPPGSETLEEADAYLKKFAEDQRAGRIHLDAGVEKSWVSAPAYVPGNFFPKRPNNLILDKKYPVVIYLHGCSGITSNHDHLWGKFLSELGFVAILPDSLARPKRVSNCDPSTQSTTHRFPMALPYREQEIAYALQQLQKTTWADLDNIFLMGHSEGANAIARTRISGFKGMILSSGYCPNGVAFDEDIKGLVINYTSDPWHKGTKARCASDLRNGRLDYLELEGAVHDTFQNKAVRERVTGFLQKNLRQK